MCGIGGYIGKSTNCQASFELATRLFAELESRGIDASGFWGAGTGQTDRIIYHKEPIKSSIFVQGSRWQEVKKFSPSLLLFHARATSLNVGHARYNKNNHPFVSSDRTIGLIHNGNVTECDFLTKEYEVRSDCDSELLLRMYEAAVDTRDANFQIPNTPDFVIQRMKAIHDIWSVANKGAMAVGFGERMDASRRILFLFRNEKRPLWLADLRDKLGQIFFFSSLDIWFKAVETCKHKIDFKNPVLAELPTNQVWFFSIDEENETVTDENFIKFEIQLGNQIREWQPKDYKRIREKPCPVPLHTILNNNDEIIDDQPKPVSKTLKNDEACYAGSLSELEETVTKIKRIADRILTQITNAQSEGVLTATCYSELLHGMEFTQRDLEGTQELLKHFV